MTDTEDYIQRFIERFIAIFVYNFEPLVAGRTAGIVDRKCRINSNDEKAEVKTNSYAYTQPYFFVKAIDLEFGIGHGFIFMRQPNIACIGKNAVFDKLINR